MTITAIVVLDLIIIALWSFAMSAALDRLTASAQALTAAADAAVAKLNAGSAANDDALGGIANAIDDATQKLNAAVNPAADPSA